MRYLLLLLFFILANTAFAADSPGIHKIMQRGKLLVAINGKNYPPLCSRNKDGNLVGHDIDLARSLGKSLGVPVEFVEAKKSFNEVVDLVKEGKADMGIGGLTPTLARAQKVTFSDPYLYVDLKLVFSRLAAAKYKLREASEVRTIPDLKIGIIRGSSFVETIKKYFPLATPVEYSTLADSLEDIKKGKIDAFFGDSTEVIYFFNQANPDTRLYFGDSTLKDIKDPIAIAIPSQYPDLVSWVNLALQLRKLNHADSGFEKQYIGS